MESRYHPLSVGAMMMGRGGWHVMNRQAICSGVVLLVLFFLSPVDSINSGPVRMISMILPQQLPNQWYVVAITTE